MIKIISILCFLFVLGLAEVVAQDRSISIESGQRDAAISVYQDKLDALEVDIKALAEELSQIVQCYQDKKIYTTAGCSASNIHYPETDPRKANHADNAIDTTCAGNQTIEFSGGTWGCKTIRYLCSNPLGC